MIITITEKRNIKGNLDESILSFYEVNISKYITFFMKFVILLILKFLFLFQIDSI